MNRFGIEEISENVTTLRNKHMMDERERKSSLFEKRARFCSSLLLCHFGHGREPRVMVASFRTNAAPCS
jgi:hypothetical protein